MEDMKIMAEKLYDLATLENTIHAYNKAKHFLDVAGIRATDVAFDINHMNLGDLRKSVMTLITKINEYRSQYRSKQYPISKKMSSKDLLEYLRAILTIQGIAYAPTETENQLIFKCRNTYFVEDAKSQPDINSPVVILETSEEVTMIILSAFNSAIGTGTYADSSDKMISLLRMYGYTVQKVLPPILETGSNTAAPSFQPKETINAVNDAIMQFARHNNLTPELSASRDYQSCYSFAIKLLSEGINDVARKYSAPKNYTPADRSNFVSDLESTLRSMLYKLSDAIELHVQADPNCVRIHTSLSRWVDAIVDAARVTATPVSNAPMSSLDELLHMKYEQNMDTAMYTALNNFRIQMNEYLSKELPALPYSGCEAAMTWYKDACKTIADEFGRKFS